MCVNIYASVNFYIYIYTHRHTSAFLLFFSFFIAERGQGDLQGLASLRSGLSNVRAPGMDVTFAGPATLLPLTPMWRHHGGTCPLSNPSASKPSCRQFLPPKEQSEK